MDLRKIKTLIDLVEESGIAELEVKEGEESVRISRYPTGGMAHQVLLPPGGYAPAPAAPAAAPAVAAPASTPAPAAPPSNQYIVKSPMVGTFYRSASPGAKAFVEVGSEIKEGDPICIIEAMKIMNEIESEVSGTIVEVCAADAHPVEYGQVLFRVRPNG